MTSSLDAKNVSPEELKERNATESDVSEVNHKLLNASAMPEPQNDTTPPGVDKDSKKKSRFEWFWDDMREPHLLWVKVIFFFQSASLVTLYPYLAIHMRSLGFTVEDTALVNSAIPLADVFGPPLAGLLADKMGNFRLFMSGVTLLNGASSLLLLAIPSVRTTTLLTCAYSSTAVGELICGDALMQDLMTLRQTTETDGEGSHTCQSGSGSIQHYELSNSSFALPDLNLTQFNVTCTSSYGVTSQGHFWSYLAARVAIDVLRASSLMLFEGAVVVIIKARGGDYGLQKLFGTLGAVILGPLTGKMIDWADEDYSSVFYLYFALRTVTAVLVLQLCLDFKPPAKKVFKDVGKVIRKVEVVSFLVAFLCAGLFWGFLETFLFWYLEDLGSTKFLMGISLAVGTLAGLPLTIFSWAILQKCGHENIVFAALVLYAVRLLGYSYIERAELSLVFELLKPFCTSLLMISTFSFVKEVSPMTTAATVEGIFGALYFGVGRGLGGLLGGFAIEGMGTRVTFRLFSCGALACALLYKAVNWLKRSRKRCKSAQQTSSGQEKSSEEATVSES